MKDDYKGFDVDEAYNWSKEWSQKISNPDGWSYKWDYLLDQTGLPKDWSGSALSDDAGRNGEQVRFALGGIGGKKRIVDMTKKKREEQEKVWKLALQSIDQARHANAPGHEPNTSKPVSGANLGKISHITTQLENLLAQINEEPMERKQFLNNLQGLNIYQNKKRSFDIPQTTFFRISNLIGYS